jgi:hypothetical protein
METDPAVAAIGKRCVDPAGFETLVERVEQPGERWRNRTPDQAPPGRKAAVGAD